MSVNNFLFDCPEECIIPHAVSLPQLGLFACYSIQPSFPVNHTGAIGKISVITNGNRSEWSGPIRSVFIRVITKSDDRVAGSDMFNHEYDYRPNWTTKVLLPIYHNFNKICDI